MHSQIIFFSKLVSVYILEKTGQTIFVEKIIKFIFSDCFNFGGCQYYHLTV